MDIQNSSNINEIIRDSILETFHGSNAIFWNWNPQEKSQLQRGTWDSEPDKVQFTNFGYDCLIVRSALGSLCGYVGVLEGHPAFGVDYHKINSTVHGGLTYSGFCNEDKNIPECNRICHKKDQSNHSNTWWLGFDCAHFRDIVPMFETEGGNPELKTYKTISFVKNEILRLRHELSSYPNKIINNQEINLNSINFDIFD